MRKLLYFVTTFAVCYIFGLGNIWLAFTAMLLLMSYFKFHDSYLWEIPLATLSCSVISIAFKDDIKIATQILMLIASIPIAFAKPGKLLIFFPVSALALFWENSYSIVLVWAMLWYGARSAFSYFITKTKPLQEYKF